MQQPRQCTYDRATKSILAIGPSRKRSPPTHTHFGEVSWEVGGELGVEAHAHGHMLHGAGCGAGDRAGAHHRRHGHEGIGPCQEAQECKRGLHLVPSSHVRPVHGVWMCSVKNRSLRLWGAPNWNRLIIADICKFFIPVFSQCPHFVRVFGLQFCGIFWRASRARRSESARQTREFAMEITHAKGTLYPALQLSSFRVRRSAVFECPLLITFRRRGRGCEDVRVLPVALWRERVLYCTAVVLFLRRIPSSLECLNFIGEVGVWARKSC